MFVFDDRTHHFMNPTRVLAHTDTAVPHLHTGDDLAAHGVGRLTHARGRCGRQCREKSENAGTQDRDLDQDGNKKWF